MNRTSVVAACRVFFAGVALVAIATQLIGLANQGTLDPVNYFSYFTIDSNLIATGVLLAGAGRRNTTSTLAFDLVRGAAVVYMSITSLDPANGGYGSVAAYSVGILIAMIVVSAITVGLANAAGGVARRGETA